MLKKIWLKNGPGSPGHTARGLIDLFNRRNQITMLDEPNEIYVSILLDRALFADRTGQSIYRRLDFDTIEDFLENDICVLTFLVLFSESKIFRDSMLPDRYGNTLFNDATEVIYEVCKKRSALCKLSLGGFKLKANEICSLSIYRV